MTNKIIYVNLLLFFMAVSSYGETVSMENGRNCRDLLQTAKSEINKNIADSIVWKEGGYYDVLHLYRNDVDTTNYNWPLTPKLEDAISSYENSSYMKDGCERVKKALLEVMQGLKDAQIRALQGDKPTKISPIRIWMLLYKGNVVKTSYFLRTGLKKGGFVEDFIINVDSKIKAIKFSGFEKYGIQCFNYSIPISHKDIQDYTGVKSDLQVFIENQETLWVLNGNVLKDTKGLTIDMIDCSEPYVPLGKALGMEPNAFESLSVISGKNAVEKYGTKETAQVVEIKTKGKSKNDVSVEDLALRMQRARLEKLEMGSKLDIDLKGIEDTVRKNPAAYQDLMNRFFKAPASLSKEEVANLYYGFAFTKDYAPLHVDLIREPRDLYRQGKMQEAYDICKRELQKAPVSLSLLWMISIVADELKMKEEAKKYYSTFTELYNAVTASGNGYSKENAIKVIFISDEYAIFRDMMGLKLVKQDFVEKRYDCMTLDRGNKGETVTLWFDAYLSYNNFPHKNR